MSLRPRHLTPVLALLLGMASFPTAAQIVTIRPAEPAVEDGGDGEPEAQPATPAAQPPVAGQPAAANAPKLTPEEIADLKETFASLSKEEKAEMKAAYTGMGIDLAAVLGPEEGVAAPMPLLDAVRNMDFARTPKAVLQARSQLGFGQMPSPDPRAAKPADLAKWLHLHVMAGEWDAFARFLAERPTAEAEALYAHILQSMNKGDPGLLPEEVLAIGNAAPGEIKDWQVDSLAKILQAAAGKYSTGPMLAQLRTGTRLFGGQDAAARKRAITLLAGAGLVREAHEYLPSLEDARAKGDAAIVVVHGRYHADLATNLRGPEADAEQTAAWGLFTEASLLPDAPFPVRQEAMRRAIDLLPHIPPSQATTWFSKVFANSSLGPAALEIVALKAMTIRDAKLDVQQRAQTILTMKEAVDTLLAHENVDTRTLRVPLRMLTTALVAEAEAAINDKGRERVIARETELLLRALPGEKWLDAIEPSLATRASKVSIAVATLADKTDAALQMLRSAMKRAPDQASDLADSFLIAWEKRLNPKPDPNEEQYYFWGYREWTPSAPVTRGRQRRNLDRLKGLIATLEQAGIHSRELPSVTAVFKACHAKTEVFDKSDIVRVFGAFDQIPAPTAGSLAMAMRASLANDWRSREVQRAGGTNRTPSEIAELVDKGYGLAIELADRALAAEPDSWRYAVIKASLSYDRMDFKQSNTKGGGSAAELAKFDSYRKDAFAAFAKAAQQYAKVLEAGQERDDAGVYQAWFGAAVAATELNYLNREDVPADASRQDDQVDMISKAIHALPKDAADRHISAFARAVEADAMGAPPEVKPRIVRHALRIIGDHPAGASLRGMNELYQDLVKDEIKLRLTVDGDDNVSVNKPFGAQLTLRFTTAVDRETGGFSKYLQNDVFTRVGNTYRSLNYRDQLKKAVEDALKKSFDIESIGFFEALTPARAVMENGEDGWQEKPMAYAVLKRKDASVDRLPQVAMDMYFNDQAGAVTLSLPSNTPPLAVTTAAAPQRPVKDLNITQVVDLRRLQTGEKDRAVVLEIQARGRGVIPDIRELMDGIDDALPGYAIDPQKGIEARPIMIQENEAPQSRFSFYGRDPEPPKEGYATADENGIYRPMIERTWAVTYLPSGGSIGTAFRLPTLHSGFAGQLVSKHYADMDILPIQGATLTVHPRRWTPLTIALAALALVVVAVGGLLLYRRLRRAPKAAVVAFHMPEKITPLSVITTLRRLQAEHASALGGPGHAELATEIATLERRYFGPESAEANGELKVVLDRWTATVRRA